MFRPVEASVPKWSFVLVLMLRSVGSYVEVCASSDARKRRLLVSGILCLSLDLSCLRSYGARIVNRAELSTEQERATEHEKSTEQERATEQERPTEQKRATE